MHHDCWRAFLTWHIHCPNPGTEPQVNIRSLSIFGLLSLAGFTNLLAQSLPETVQLAWTAQPSSLIASSRDAATAGTADAAGNVYVAAKSEAPRTGYDYLILKSDNTGSLIWSARYDGPGHGNDIPLAIEVDTDSNVYVTGISTGTAYTGFDVATLKYNSTGSLVWSESYSPMMGCEWGTCWFATDAGVDLCVDQSGNVFVAGYVTEDWDVMDMLTIKYGAGGSEEWVRTYDGPLHGLDRAVSVLTDGAGGVYVTGVGSDSTFYDPDGFASGLILRYDSSGNILWEQMLSADEGRSTEPVSAALDAGGNIYITGNVYGAYTFGRGHENDCDIFTAKYSASGSIEWIRVFSTDFLFDTFPPTMYDVAVSMTVDDEGNVVIVGRTGRNDMGAGAGDSLLALKYQNDGNLQWAIYEGNGSPESLRPAGIVTDLSGNVYIAATSGLADGRTFTGNAEVLLKYRASGEREWSEYYGAVDDTVRYATGLVTDVFGNLFVIGESGVGSESDCTALKYSSSGAHVATLVAGGPGAIAGFAADARVDAQGNVYLAGTTVGKGMNQDYMIAKINPLGDVVWASSYDGPDNSIDNAQGIALDRWGNVYVTGLSIDSEGRSASATMKYSSTGKQLWVSRLDSSSMRVIYIAPDGSVYAGGAGLARFAPDGSLLWHDSALRVTALSVGDSDAVYVAGDGLRKLHPSGEEIWSIAVSAKGLAVDDSHNVYVSASYWSGDYTKKLSPAGVELWTAYGGGDKIILYDSNTIYVGGGYYARVSKLTADGEVVWSNTISADRKRDFDVDADGNVYYAGSTNDGTGLHAAKFSAEGETEWTLQKEEIFDAVAIRADHLGNALLISEKEELDLSRSPLVEKYVLETVVAVSEGNGSSPARFRLEQNYPNPFNPSTRISYSVPYSGTVSLRIFNLLGEEVATLVSGQQDAGTHAIQWDATGYPSGVYFYRLSTGQLVETKKLVLLK